MGNAFTDFFFNEIWKKNDNSDIGREDSELEHYGHLAYAKSMVDFQKFIFDEWLEIQKPVLLCKKSWDFSPSISDNLYKTEKITLPEKPNFNFPDFKTKKDEILSFNSAGKCNDKAIVVSDDLLKMDGREIDAFIPKYFGEINKSTNPSTNDTSQGDSYDNMSTDKSIYKIFSQTSSPSSSNVTQPNGELIDSSGDLKDIATNHFLS